MPDFPGSITDRQERLDSWQEYLDRALDREERFGVIDHDAPPGGPTEAELALPAATAAAERGKARFYALVENDRDMLSRDTLDAQESWRRAVGEVEELQSIITHGL